MNYLGHLYLSRHHPELMPGVFLGDHVKGRLNGDRPAHIEMGIQFHRATDVFTDNHPAQKTSIDRLPKHLRRYGGIICDVVYDFYLANHWPSFSDDDYEYFCQNSYAQILKEADQLPTGPTNTIKRMQQHGSLEGYRSKLYVERSLDYISGRLKRDNPLGQAFDQFERFEADFEADFLGFVPEVTEFGRTWLEQHYVTSAGPRTY